MYSEKALGWDCTIIACRLSELCAGLREKPARSKKRRKLAAIPKFFFEQNSRARSWWKIQLSEAP
jgi:hypothetical protein